MDGQRPSAGRFQTRGAELARQTLQAQASSVALLGMRTVLHLPAHDARCGPDALAPGNQPLRRPLPVRSVRGGHVLLDSGVLTAPAAQGMAGHALVAGKRFHRSGGDAQLHFGAHQTVRHGVEVAVELDVVGDVHAGAFPARQLEACRWQRPQRRLVQLLEGTAPAAGQLLERPLIQFGEQCTDGGIQFGQAEEAPVAQLRQDPALASPPSDRANGASPKCSVRLCDSARATKLNAAALARSRSFITSNETGGLRDEYAETSCVRRCHSERRIKFRSSCL
jgi:hypothetical protein